MLTDNGTEFKVEFVQLLKAKGCKQIFSLPQRPKGNSQCKRIHDPLCRMITKLQYRTSLDWDQVMHKATYLLNTLPSADGLESPFFITTGRDPPEGVLTNLRTCMHSIN